MKNPYFHSKTNNIDVQYHFVWYKVEDKKMLVVKVDTLMSVADSLKKSMIIDNFSWCIEKVHITSLDCWSSTTSGIMLGMCYILCMTSQCLCNSSYETTSVYSSRVNGLWIYGCCEIYMLYYNIVKTWYTKKSFWFSQFQVFMVKYLC